MAKIIDYPIVETDIMGGGEGFLLGANLSDVGGRNHAHSTRLLIKSGNFTNSLDLPVIINARKGMTIQLYYNEKEINQVFCDGVIYKLSK